MTHNRYENKVALITGGSSGMGLAGARRLLAEGARVVVTGRDPARLDAAVAELGGDVLGVPGDATDLADLRRLTAAVAGRYGRLDVLFANAGIGAFQPLAEVTEPEFHRVMDANVKAAFFTIQQALPLMVDGGAIVINASFALHRGVPGAALYSASKAAVHNLARTLAAELAPRRIRVNSVSPGFIDTPALRAESTPQVRAAAAATVVAGRIGRAEEVAAAFAFLASDEASYVNGHDLVIDGGLTAAVPAPLL
ncbi:short-chain dehydrogenase [Longispora fulva]|uniref:NAD(P)-dependent dehydrogenase (Short-subunit alcohol dehydrogenase family) n=1 Tax=Longispora fulva TaxID=619741 RepID=A0A8J7GFL5_9ACTN|nr:glucose 1-dehydrogenase [Longispora fulva]MBG6135652.1 NAD(P)-dependent dehydrogenase (short-subunit alcohol dehydrogenase family) [Longispora fulva]GIG56109.1 short-chain dehydrogenase [Longispora fulva]